MGTESIARPVLPSNTVYQSGAKITAPCFSAQSFFGSPSVFPVPSTVPSEVRTISYARPSPSKSYTRNGL